MATLSLQDRDLVVTLNVAEKLGALMGDLRVPVDQIKSIRVSEHPYAEIRGIRVGTGLPWVVLLGRWYTLGEGVDMVAVYGRRHPTAIIEFRDGAPFARALISDPDAAVVAELQRRTAASA